VIGEEEAVGSSITRFVSKSLISVPLTVISTDKDSDHSLIPKTCTKGWPVTGVTYDQLRLLAGYQTCPES